MNAYVWHCRITVCENRCPGNARDVCGLVGVFFGFLCAIQLQDFDSL